jgi:hypothetical protein
MASLDDGQELKTYDPPNRFVTRPAALRELRVRICCPAEVLPDAFPAPKPPPPTNTEQTDKLRKMQSIEQAEARAKAETASWEQHKKQMAERREKRLAETRMGVMVPPEVLEARRRQRDEKRAPGSAGTSSGPDLAGAHPFCTGVDPSNSAAPYGTADAGRRTACYSRQVPGHYRRPSGPAEAATSSLSRYSKKDRVPPPMTLNTFWKNKLFGI